MPALNAYSPTLDPPCSTRRRVWSHPVLQSHSLLVLTRDELYLSPLSGVPRPEAVAAAAADADLDELLGSLATVIDLASVRRAKLDLLSNSLILDYSRGQQKCRLVLTFSTPIAADACFSRVWRRLGEGCVLRPHQRAWWPLARSPLTLLGAILAATALLAFAITLSDNLATANAAASVNVPGEEHRGGPVLIPPALHSLIGWMDWRAVCALGGGAAAFSQVWLYRRLTHPPVSLEVIRP